MCNTYSVLWIQKLAQMYMYMYAADEHELFIRPFVIQSVYMYMYIQLTAVYMESRGPVNVHVHVYV